MNQGYHYETFNNGVSLVSKEGGGGVRGRVCRKREAPRKG
jgi:hypothetical protein